MSALGGLFGLAGAGLSSAFAIAAAKEQRKWQEKMAGSAYQRTMKDMEKAGLNPILAYKTGPTSAGQGTTAMTPDFGSAITGGMERGASAALKKEQVSESKEKQDLAAQHRFQSYAQEEQIRSATLTNIASARKLNAEARGTEAGLPEKVINQRMYESVLGPVVVGGKTAAKALLPIIKKTPAYIKRARGLRSNKR